MGKGAQGSTGNLFGGGDDLFAMMGMKRFNILDEPKSDEPDIEPGTAAATPKLVDVICSPTSSNSVSVSLRFHVHGAVDAS